MARAETGGKNGSATQRLSSEVEDASEKPAHHPELRMKRRIVVSYICAPMSGRWSWFGVPWVMNPSDKEGVVADGSVRAEVRLRSLQPGLASLLRERNPGLDEDSLLSMEVVNEARLDYVRRLLEKQVGDLSRLDEEVLESLHKQAVLSERPPSEAEERHALSFGERLSDRMAEFGGSWRFILTFGAIMAFWITLNAGLLLSRPFDLYPFILLNLVLSCLAALQAPVIMMSQNRQEERDRQRAEGDYKVNLKAELEIRHLHEKMDFLLHHHAAQLMELQQLQMELLHLSGGQQGGR